MEAAQKQVLIGGVVYTLNSDNKALLSKMPPTKVKNKDTGKREEVQYPYIPISIIKTLLDGLTDYYHVDDQGAKYEEEYNVKKEYNGEVTEELRRCYSYSITYTISLDGVCRMLKGYCRGVASTKILSNDSSANGFFQKLAARATKSALKNFAKIFRMGDEADDVIDGESSPADLETTKAATKPYTPREDKKKSQVLGASNDTTQAIMDEISKGETTENSEDSKTKTAEIQDQTSKETNQAIAERYQGRFNTLLANAGTTKKHLGALVKSIREDEGIKSEKDARLDILKKVYEDSVNALSVLDEAEVKPQEEEKTAEPAKKTRAAKKPKKDVVAAKQEVTEKPVSTEANVADESDGPQNDEARYEKMFTDFLSQDGITLESLKAFCKKIKKDEDIQDGDPKLEIIKRLWVEAKECIPQDNDI